MSERARALEQALRAIRATLQGVSPNRAVNAAAEAWSIACATLAVDPPPSGASPQAETSALARLREFVTQAQAGTKQRRKGQYYLGEIVGIQGTLNVLLAEIDKLAQQPTCRVCGGYGFVAQKQTIDDGWGEVDTCPACSDQPAPVSPVEPEPPTVECCACGHLNTPQQATRLEGEWRSSGEYVCLDSDACSRRIAKCSERPVEPEPCVWRESGNRLTKAPCFDSPWFGRHAVAAWKVCPYCGAPLKVER